MKSLKFVCLNNSSLKVGASLEFESLHGNPAWKFEAAATFIARRSKAKDRGGTRRGSQSRPQARVRKFESLEFESLKPRGLKKLKVRKLQTLKVRMVSNFGGVEGLKCSSFESSKV